MTAWKELAQYCVPAASVGAAAGLVAGGLAALVALGKVPAGVFAPAAVYWVIAFPLSLLVHAIVTEWVVTGTPGLPAEPWKFLAFRALLSMGFAIGFLWMHDQIARFWWPRILKTNQYARRTVGRYGQLATALADSKLDSTYTPTTRAHHAHQRAQWTYTYCRACTH
jgi:hypothetical protein